MKKEKSINEIKKIVESIKDLDIDEQIDFINKIKVVLHKNSPFVNEPVDCVLWVKQEEVEANDYNPNAVAPPEMELLHTSISEDGYTQPIVSWKHEEMFEVVDGFHRSRVGREYEDVKARIHGYLPLVVVNDEQSDRGDRIAATIRHNRARGKHKIESMSEIVLELKRRNWSDKKIADKVGLDQDEILRLTQISGLTEMFADKEFTMAWDIGDVNEVDHEALD